MTCCSTGPLWRLDLPKKALLGTTTGYQRRSVSCCEHRPFDLAASQLQEGKFHAKEILARCGDIRHGNRRRDSWSSTHSEDVEGIRSARPPGQKVRLPDD